MGEFVCVFCGRGRGRRHLEARMHVIVGVPQDGDGFGFGRLGVSRLLTEFAADNRRSSDESGLWRLGWLFAARRGPRSRCAKRGSNEVWDGCELDEGTGW